MCHREACLHAEPPVERRLSVVPEADRATGFHLARVGGDHCRDNLPLHAGQVFGIRRHRLVVHQRLDQRRGVVKLAGQEETHRPRGMGMGRGDHHRFWRDSALLLDLLPDGLDRRPPDEQGIDPDHRDPRLTVGKYRRPHFARIMQRPVIRFAVPARRFHADLRRNVPFGEAGSERGFSGRSCGRGKQAGKPETNRAQDGG